MKVSKHLHVFEPVKIGGDAVWHLRPATSIDTEQASAEVMKLLAGIAESAQQVEKLTAIFGETLELDAPLTVERLSAVTLFLSDVHLAMICSGGWENVEDAEGTPVPEPDHAWAALVMMKPVVRARIKNVIYGELKHVASEKKESPASRDGAAAAAGEPAAIASPAESPAPGA